MMDEFYAGILTHQKFPQSQRSSIRVQAHYHQDKTPEFIIKILQFLVSPVILGVAVGIRFYTKAL
ncbi:hypothetical protein Hdeb2414_s0008g00289121 [Helianthus debilis subsp. tardiflorus]